MTAATPVVTMETATGYTESIVSRYSQKMKAVAMKALGIQGTIGVTCQKRAENED